VSLAAARPQFGAGGGGTSTPSPLRPAMESSDRSRDKRTTAWTRAEDGREFVFCGGAAPSP